MITKPTALASFAAVAITLTAVASASSAPAKQRVIITQKDGAGFVLSPQASGPIKPDTGTANFCCWTTRPTTKDGQEVDINNPQMTLIGKHGTIVARNEIGFITSAAFSPAAGTAIGMGYVRREQFAPGSKVEYDGGTAEVAGS